jgi:tetrahydromethanopterin S-methyltransferase subunit A
MCVLAFIDHGRYTVDTRTAGQTGLCSLASHMEIVEICALPRIATSEGSSIDNTLDIEEIIADYTSNSTKFYGMFDHHFGSDYSIRTP